MVQVKYTYSNLISLFTLKLYLFTVKEFSTLIESNLVLAKITITFYVSGQYDETYEGAHG